MSVVHSVKCVIFAMKIFAVSNSTVFPTGFKHQKIVTFNNMKNVTKNKIFIGKYSVCVCARAYILLFHHIYFPKSGTDALSIFTALMNVLYENDCL